MTPGALEALDDPVDRQGFADRSARLTDIFIRRRRLSVAGRRWRAHVQLRLTPRP